MTVDGAQWVVGGGTGPYWREVAALRVEAAAAQLRAAALWLRRSGPPSLARFGLARSFADVLAAPAPVRERLLLFPAFDCWLSLTASFLGGGRPLTASGGGTSRVLPGVGRTEAEAELHFAYFQSFAAACAALAGRTRRLRVRLSAQARFHATGTRCYFEFPRAAAGQEAECAVSGGRIHARWRGRPGRARLLPALTEDLWVEGRDPLVLQPVVMHGLARPTPAEERRFARVLSGAMARIRAVDPPLYEEMGGLMRLLVPLENPEDYGSVSSSYRNLRGALCLSHSDDSLLQEETIIHEFCHQKVNMLLAADPLLKPGQGGQVVYSPLRPDARRLAGLLLGAHAFINVNRYLLRVLRREAFPARARASVQSNVARRLYHVDDMLRTVSLYADLTPAGARFQERMWREHALTLHDALDIPAALMAEGRKRWREHREAKALAETGLFAGEGA